MSETTTINVAELSADQLLALRKQLRAQAKAAGGDLKQRWEIVDRMLQERNADDTGFKHTTNDILEELVAKKVAVIGTAVPRAEWLKRIQTRKQDLDRKPEFKGKVGYKPSGFQFGALTADRVVDWIIEHGKADLTKADVTAILKALK